MIIADGMCNHCNPNFVFSGTGASKIACHCLDTLEKELHLKIQHRHVDYAAKTWTGDEHRPLEWQRKSVDGFFVDTVNGCNVAIEFLGDYWHGHPRFWGPNNDHCNFHGKLFKHLFIKTEEKLQKLKRLGYKVFYIWESEYNVQTHNVISLCREFVDKLCY